MKTNNQNTKTSTPEPTGKKCSICGNKIDRSDPQKTWLTITRKSYYIGEKKIPTKRFVICHDCIFEVWANDYFPTISERILEA